MAKETTEQRRARFYAAVDLLLPYCEAEMPSLGNRTPGSLVDDAGPMKELEKELTRVVKILNGIIDSKLQGGETEFSGENYKMKLTAVSQRKLHQANAKKILEDNGFLEGDYMYDLDMTQHRYTKL